MKFISKLYFNIFKRTGNLRLIFVISCILAGISLAIVIINAMDNVYYYHINSNTINPEKDPSYTMSEDKREILNFMRTVRFCNDGNLEKAWIVCPITLCNSYNLNPEQLKQLKPWEQYAWVDKSETALCKDMNSQYPKGIIATKYSFSYLWNLLWVTFWFYLPFIIILPIKFIVDGYKKDGKK